MEFEELQTAWDTQATQPPYSLNEKAFRDRLARKIGRTHHFTQVIELSLIIVYIGAGLFITTINSLSAPHYIFLYVLSAWMLATGFFVLANRVRRIRGSQRFNRSIHGDLEHAISTASYQIYISRFMRVNMLPIGLLLLLSVQESGKTVWIGVGVFILFILAFFLGGWEHRRYQERRNELLALKRTLENL